MVPTTTNTGNVERKPPGFWHWTVMILALIYAMFGAIDILPDIIPVLGELDDAGALLLALRMAAPIFKSDFGIRPY